MHAPSLEVKAKQWPLNTPVLGRASSNYTHQTLSNSVQDLELSQHPHCYLKELQGSWNQEIHTKQGNILSQSPELPMTELGTQRGSRRFSRMEKQCKNTRKWRSTGMQQSRMRTQASQQWTSRWVMGIMQKQKRISTSSEVQRRLPQRMLPQSSSQHLRDEDPACSCPQNELEEPGVQFVSEIPPRTAHILFGHKLM